MAVGLVVGSACRAGGDTAADYALTTDVTPKPTHVGEPATVSIELLGGPGKARWTGASLQLEAHMAHPGMAPVVVTAVESEPGRYRAPVTFSMAGDWKLVVTGTLPDGRRVQAASVDHSVAEAATGK